MELMTYASSQSCLLRISTDRPVSCSSCSSSISQSSGTTAFLDIFGLAALVDPEAMVGVAV